MQTTSTSSENQKKKIIPCLDYDRQCIQAIKDGFINYVIINGRIPIIVTIGPYEMQEVQKARRAGVRMEVVIDGLPQRIPIQEAPDEEDNH